MEEMKEPEIFGLYSPNEPKEYYSIKANPAGLRKFAANLSEIADSLDSQERVYLTGENNKYNWIQQAEPIEFIERVDSIKEFYSNETESIPKWQETLFKIGCWLIVILFLLPFFAGLQTIYNWFF